MSLKDSTDYGELLASLESVVTDLNDMENMIENFDDATAEPLFAKVNEYIRNLKEVQRLGPTCRLVVPTEALERMDNDFDQNPEVFAQELLNRCKGEFGQLNTRVKGIEIVREAVAEGWKSRASWEGVARQATADGSVSKEGVVKEDARQPVAKKNVKAVRGAVEDGRRVRVKREAVKPEDLPGGACESEGGSTDDTAQRPLAKRIKSVRDGAADGWRNRGKGFVKREDAVNDSEPEEGAVEDVAQQAVARKPLPSSAGFRATGFRGTTTPNRRQAAAFLPSGGSSNSA